MKRIEQLYRTVVLAALVTLAAACTRYDGLDDAAPGNAASPAAVPLVVTVTDGGYAPETPTHADAAPADTRAVDNGYATEFTAGDRIGLYVAEVQVDADGTPTAHERMIHENLCLTYNGTEWRLANNEELKHTPPADGCEIRYYAYYPYQSIIPDYSKPDGTNEVGTVARTDSEFFHKLIYYWKPKDDQSTYADYTASDLMTAQGVMSTLTNNAVGFMLNFTMKHRMLLNIILLPHTTCYYKETIGGKEFNKSYNLYTGVAQLPKFWKETPHQARRITNPYRDAIIYDDGSYYNSNFEKRSFYFIMIRSEELSGKYQLYTIDEATETESNRGAPQEGDFYMKDGTVLPKEEFNNGATIPAKVKDDCIGVVFWVGEKEGRHWTQTGNREGDRLLMHEHPECTHGMVVALTNATDKAQWATNPAAGSSLPFWAKNNSNKFTGKENSLWNIADASDYDYGYIYNAYFELYIAHNNGAAFPAYEAVKTYAGSHPTPEGCSGWFFPGLYELATMFFGAPINYDNSSSPYYSHKWAMLKIINPQIEKSNGNIIDGQYWSCKDDDVRKVWYVRANGTYSTEFQTNSNKVRAVLAF